MSKLKRPWHKNSRDVRPRAVFFKTLLVIEHWFVGQDY